MSSGGQSTLVVGAGVSGLAAAVLLARAGRAVEVWEASSEAGGLLRPVDFRGVRCDLGAHRLHAGARELLGATVPAASWLLRPRRGVLVLNGRHVDYPLQWLSFLRGLGLRESLRLGWTFAARHPALLRFLRWESDRRRTLERPAADDDGFEQFVSERVGPSAYRRFYRPYAEKVWGLPPAELSASVAKKRVATGTPWQVLAQVLGRPDPLARSYLYPPQGMGQLVGALEAEARALGVHVRYGARFERADLARGPWEAVLYGGHLGELAGAAGERLAHRGLYLVYLALPRRRLGETDTFYLPESGYWFGRVSEVQNFSGASAREGETVVCLEIPEGRHGPSRDFVAELPALMEQLVRADIVPAGVEPLEARQVFLPRVYPLYRRGWRGHWMAAMNEVASSDGHRRRPPMVLPIGRQGLFLHCNIDHCIEVAHQAVRHLLDGGDARGWIPRAASFLDVRVRD